MTKVYRVEYPDNHRGPYNPGVTEWPIFSDGPEFVDTPAARADIALRMGYAHGWAGAIDTHPTPTMGGFDMAGSVSGFRSMRDLVAWFGGWLAPLKRAGARVATYDVPESAIRYDDGRQIAFADQFLN